MPDEYLTQLMTALHEHLSATGTYAVDEQTNRWLGEAQAVANDALGPNVPASVIRKRARQVGELLEHVEPTNNQPVDDHIEAARAIVEDIEDQ